MAITYKCIALTIAFLLSCVSSQRETKFLNHGFLEANLLKFGSSKIQPSGLLELTNSSMRQMGQAFHGFPISFINPNSTNSVSFSTSFVFAITPGPSAPGHGLTFVISPSMEFSGALPSSYLGLFNTSNNGNSSNRILAVEFDTVQSIEMKDIDDNHVGIDLNGVISIDSAPAAYFDDQEAKNISLKLASGERIRAWIEYNSTDMLLNVTLAPLKHEKPNLPLLSKKLNLSEILSKESYVGFSAATGTIASTHMVLGWTFSIEGKASEFDISKLPSLPVLPSPSPYPTVTVKKSSDNIQLIILSVALGTIGICILIIIFLKVWGLRTNDIYITGGTRRFSHKTISVATKGFDASTLLGENNTGSFYKGELSTGEIIAVKRITCGTRQQEATLRLEFSKKSRLSQGNLVNLIGYGRNQNDMYIVYEYIPNGSLDRFLFNTDRPVLTWQERFNIIRGIASAIQYIHCGINIPLIHGSIEASNVLLDQELNSRLGDYVRENTETTAASGDVYSFGKLIFEICCGRRAIEGNRRPEEISLVNLVLQGFTRGDLLQCADPRITRDELVAPQMLLVLKTALLCVNQSPEDRPTMNDVIHYLDGTRTLPEDNNRYLQV